MWPGTLHWLTNYGRFGDSDRASFTCRVHLVRWDDGVDQLLGGLPAAARIADVSLPSPCPITTPAAVSRRPPTDTCVKKARHPPAAESDPVLPA